MVSTSWWWSTGRRLCVPRRTEHTVDYSNQGAMIKTLEGMPNSRWGRRRAGLMALAVLLFFVISLCARSATAQDDYDPQSRQWNGTSELSRMASESGIELVPSQQLDWESVPQGSALLVLWPKGRVGLADLEAFLDDGGRVAWLDDFGSSTEFYSRYGFRRSPVVGGVARAPGLPELLVARPRGVHPLSDGVDVLVTNLPMAISHDRLTPVFDFAGSGQGLVLVGQIGRGKLLVGGDPSVLLNTMLQFEGNRHFAQNLLNFLVTSDGRPSRRITLVWGDLHATGMYRGRTQARTRQRAAVNSLNTALRDLSSLLGTARALPLVSLAFLLLSVASLSAVALGKRPSERFGPRGPVGTTAGVTERISIFSSRGANLLLPILVARTLLETALLRAARITPPTDVRRVLSRAGEKLTEAQREDVRALLVDLDALAATADDPRTARLGARRFLSLWRRIDAILRGLARDAR